jgi:small subunit ribosomal protein S1
VDALVLIKEDTEGRLILSKKRARFELAWKNIERAAESGEPVTGRVIEVVKGGLILDLGVRGFRRPRSWTSGACRTSTSSSGRSSAAR